MENLDKKTINSIAPIIKKMRTHRRIIFSLLAITSLILFNSILFDLFTEKIGNYYIIAVVAAIIALALVKAIDGSLPSLSMFVMSEWTNEHEEIKGNRKKLRNFFTAIFIILFSITALASLLSSFVLSDLVTDDKSQEIKHFNAVIEGNNDTYSKGLKTLELQLDDAKKTKTQRIKSAKQKKKILISEAVSKGSISWQNDYRKHRKNKGAWFWTCQDCPYKYKKYRNSILAAELEGNNLISLEENLVNEINKSISDYISIQGNKNIDTSTILSKTSEIVASKWMDDLSSNTFTFFYIDIVLAILALAYTFIIAVHDNMVDSPLSKNDVTFTELAERSFGMLVRKIKRCVLNTLQFENNLQVISITNNNTLNNSQAKNNTKSYLRGSVNITKQVITKDNNSNDNQIIKDGGLENNVSVNNIKVIKYKGIPYVNYINRQGENIKADKTYCKGQLAAYKYKLKKNPENKNNKNKLEEWQNRVDAIEAME